MTEVYSADDLTVLRDTGVKMRSLGLLLLGGGCFAAASQIAPIFAELYAVVAIAGLVFSCTSIVLLLTRKTIVLDRMRRILLLKGDRIPFERVRSVKMRLTMQAGSVYLSGGAVQIALDCGRLVDLGKGSGYEAASLACRVAAEIGVEPCSELVNCQDVVSRYSQNSEGPVV